MVLLVLVLSVNPNNCCHRLEDRQDIQFDNTGFSVFFNIQLIHTFVSSRRKLCLFW